MNNEYNIGVWDLTFYKADEFGKAVTDNEGSIQLYHAPYYDCTYLAECVTEDDLVDIEP